MLRCVCFHNCNFITLNVITSISVNVWSITYVESANDVLCYLLQDHCYAQRNQHFIDMNILKKKNKVCSTMGIKVSNRRVLRYNTFYLLHKLQVLKSGAICLAYLLPRRKQILQPYLSFAITSLLFSYN